MPIESHKYLYNCVTSRIKIPEGEVLSEIEVDWSWSETSSPSFAFASEI